MVKLHFDIFETTTGNIIEVSASGEDIADRARNVPKLGHVTESTPVLLGNLDERGRYWEEWGFDLDIDPEWVKSHVPEAVKQRAWGKTLDNPRRPPKLWMKHCVAGVKAGGSAADPGAVCGALWYKKMSPSQRRAALRREGKDMNENPTQFGDPYYTVVIPYAPPERATQWHPTESTGPFSTLTRGAFKTKAEAHAWAKKHLGGTSYSVYRKDMNENPADAYKTWLMGVRRQLQRTGFGDASPVFRTRERELRGIYLSGGGTAEGARFVGEAYQRGDYAANPMAESTALLIGLGALVVVGVGIWYVNKAKEGAGTALPPAANCSFEENKVRAFAKTRGLYGSLLTTWNVKDANGQLEAPAWSAYTALVPADQAPTPSTPFGAWTPPLVVLNDSSFWTYDTSVSPAKPVRRDDLRNEYCNSLVKRTVSAAASAFLPGGG